MISHDLSRMIADFAGFIARFNALFALIQPASLSAHQFQQLDNAFIQLIAHHERLPFFAGHLVESFNKFAQCGFLFGHDIRPLAVISVLR